RGQELRARRKPIHPLGLARHRHDPHELPRRELSDRAVAGVWEVRGHARLPGLVLRQPNRSVDCQHYYSAAMRAAVSTRSTFAAQYLNSGILPNGSSAGLVRRLAAASTKANGMNTTPSGIASSWRTESSIDPRRVETRTMSPALMPRRSMVPRETLATAPGSRASSVAARRVMAPVC